jgi:dienelactone hydrolase
MNIIPHRRWLVMAWLVLAACALPPDARAQSPRPNTFSDLQKQLLDQDASINRFRQRGPFAVTVRQDRELRLSAKERILADVYLASPAEKAPLVIFLHGHDCSKEAHAKQAAHVASWGMHAVSVQLAKTGPWDVNARTLGRIVSLIRRTPGVIDNRIDVNRIILVGHSFGGHAVAVAMAQGAPVAGGILLDPAYFGRATPEFLYKIKKPVMVLGADETQSPVRRREYFYDYIQSDVVEVSIKDATHEDAQFPSETSLQNAGIDAETTEELQITFVSGITATAFSLSATRTLDYAWASLREMVDSGKMFNPKKK